MLYYMKETFPISSQIEITPKMITMEETKISIMKIISLSFGVFLTLFVFLYLYTDFGNVKFKIRI